MFQGCVFTGVRYVRGQVFPGSVFSEFMFFQGSNFSGVKSGFQESGFYGVSFLWGQV